MNMLHHCVILMLISGPAIQACARGRISIDNNGYKHVLIAISDAVPESPALLTSIRAAFTEASQFLYTATRQRAYFAEITILVPHSWQNGDYAAATSEAEERSDIVIDEPRLDQGHAPFVIKTTPCGEPGHYMHLTPQYLTDDEIALAFGSYGRVLVHEWSHLRYGVFDEYPSGTGAQYFYATGDGEIEAVRCSLQITGRLENVDTGGRCRYENNMPEEDCRFRDVDDPGSDGHGSIMYKSYLSQIDEFCDDDVGNAETLHNAEAPTAQNLMCGMKSVWQVLREHADFNGTNERRVVSDTTPSFRIVQRKLLRTVLVLDRSGSMTAEYLLIQAQGCSNYITDIVQDNEQVGVVSFNTQASREAPLTSINSTTRVTLLDSIPTTAEGGTSIGAGIREALAMLSGAEGGTIIVVTDGEENEDPRIADITDDVAAAGVTIHSIAITMAADTALDVLAAQTGGLSFIFAGNSSNAINEAFTAIGQLNTNPTERSYTVLSMGLMLPASATRDDSVMIDSSLGRGTVFIFDYTGSEISATVTSPDGTVYSDTHDAVTHDGVFGTHRFTIPDSDFQAGTWQYSVTSLDSTRMRVAVSVTSQSATEGSYPIIAHVNWGRREINAIDPNEYQILYATVSQGYAPVIDADVVATVETPGAQIVQVTLRDKGSGADAFSDDGIYSGYYVTFDESGRYGVQVTVNNNEATVIRPTTIIGRGAATNVFERDSSDASDTSVSSLQRTANGGTFQLNNFTGASGVKLYSPGRITDLLVTAASYDNRTVTLQWTAVGDQLDTGTASLYELRIATNFSAMIDSFSSQTLITSDDVSSGSDLGSPLPAGQQEAAVILVPGRGAVTYVFGIIARDTDGRDVTGPLSNIATVSMQDFSVNENEKQESEQLSTFEIVLLASGAGLALFVVLVVIAIVAWEPCSNTTQSVPYKYMTSHRHITSLSARGGLQAHKLPRHDERLSRYSNQNHYHV